MKTWLKITLASIAVLIVLLILNAIALDNQTKEAKLNADNARIVKTLGGDLQVKDEGPVGDLIKIGSGSNSTYLSTSSPIVLLHCYTCSMKWWDQLAPLLDADHRVIRIDLLGHGGSEKAGNGYSMQDQADAVASALHRLGVTGATVVGHSLGFTVATALAESSPKLVARLVDIDQAPDSSFGEISSFDKLGYVPVLGQALYRTVPNAVVRDKLKIAFAPGFNLANGFENPDQPVRDFREMTYTSYKDSFQAEIDYTDEQPLDQRLAALGIHLLVMFGAEDQIYDAEPAAEAYRIVPRAKIAIIPGAGHSPNVEKPQEAAGLISTFINADEARLAPVLAKTKAKAARARAKAQAAAKKQAKAQRKAKAKKTKK